MEALAFLLFVTLGLLAILAIAKSRGLGPLKPVTVYDFQAGLLYQGGRFLRQLGPGRYSLFWPGTSITILDTREQLMTVEGQEMLTTDSLTVKTSAVVRYRIADAVLAHRSVSNLVASFYSEAQLSLRRAVAARTLEGLLAERGEAGRALLEGLREPAKRIGLEVLGADLRDLMLAGETKRAFADIFKARKDGEAHLERARSETAALRSLANGARMLRDNPRLFDLRLLQALSTPAGKGTSVILNVGGASGVVPVAGEAKPESDDDGPR